MHISDIVDSDRRALGRGQHDIPNIAQRMDKADAANVEGLFADREIIARRRWCSSSDRVDQGGERNLVIGQVLRIDVDLVLLGEPAKTGDIDHTRNSLELLFKHPVLDLLLLDQVMIGTFNRIAIDFANRILGRNSRAGCPGAA